MTASLVSFQMSRHHCHRHHQSCQILDKILPLLKAKKEFAVNFNSQALP